MLVKIAVDALMLAVVDGDEVEEAVTLFPVEGDTCSCSELASCPIDLREDDAPLSDVVVTFDEIVCIGSFCCESEVSLPPDSLTFLPLIPFS